MAEATEDTSIVTPFTRQRRNLILISVLLFFSQFHKVTLSKVSLFGNELRLGVPLNPELYLWIAFLYLLWRYYTYFLAIGNIGFSDKHHLKLADLVQAIAVKKLSRDESLVKVMNNYLHNTGTDKWQVLKSKLLEPPTGTRWYLEVKTQGVSADGKDTHALTPVGVEVKGFSVVLAQVRAWLFVLFCTTLFSEYVIPFIIAAFPIIFGAYRWFQAGRLDRTFM